MHTFAVSDSALDEMLVLATNPPPTRRTLDADAAREDIMIERMNKSNF